MKDIITIATAILSSGLLSLQQFFNIRKKEKIKDYKTFLAELEQMHEKLLEAKEVIMKLTVENEQQKETIDNLNAKINELESIIKQLQGTTAA